MNRQDADFGMAKTLRALLVILALPGVAWAQVPVDEDGEVIGNYESVEEDLVTGNEEIPLMSAVDLEELVGPIALYPDDLLAIVLPASAYPLQIIEAARFLEQLEDDPSLEPDPDWDDSVVALTNYPEVVELLNDDIDWTWRLGEAVVSQQADVVAAIEAFRDRAYAAGNLKSDSYQTVSRDDGVIEITPVVEDTIYVPYYEPERVVVYQPRPVYYYYPRAYPVYYYPYPSWHAFNRGYFWGVTTAFTIGWYSDSLNVFHHSYYGHPYYGRSYRDRWWYRRPTVSIYNHHYVAPSTTVTINHYHRGDRWRPRHDRRHYVDERRITRNRYNPTRRHVSASNRVPRVSDGRRRTTPASVGRQTNNREPITFRERPRTPTISRQAPGDRGVRPTDRRERRDADNRRGAGDRQQRPETTARVRDADRSRPARRPEPRVEARRPETSAQLRRSEASERTRRFQPATQNRRSERSERTRRTQPVEQTRRAEPTAQSRRQQQLAQLRRAEPARETRRSPATQARRAQPTRQVAAASQPRRQQQAAQPRRTEAVRETRRSSPAPQTRRAEPSRRAAAVSQPRRQQQAAGKSARSSEGRQRGERQSSRRRK